MSKSAVAEQTGKRLGQDAALKKGEAAGTEKKDRQEKDKNLKKEEKIEIGLGTEEGSGLGQGQSKDKDVGKDKGNDEVKDKGNEREPEPEEDLNTRYLRLMADFQNYKRRTEKEKSELYAYANEKLVGDLLEIIDDFERALAHEGGAGESFMEGMRMIFKNFKGVLEKSGMEEIGALGLSFDPNVHNAVMTEKNAEAESGIICEVLQKGYKLNKKVIRPSMVKVVE